MAHRTDAAAPIGGALAALVLLGASVSSWIDQPVVRAIGDVAVDEVRATAGYEIASLALVAALACLACSVGLLLTRAAARRTVALLLTCTGVVAVSATAVGIVRLTALPGDWTVAPGVAAVGSVGMLAAGLRGFGRPGRRLPPRYDVDAPPEDDEWRMASVGDETGPGASYPSPPPLSAEPTDDEAEHR